mmetsp:Transcript_22279/g.62132  ORF Transcript_22279/g.62132 Transcript_22279/m.62132 type:complete len:168 (+) Transcript_22279:382-885(+)
MNARNIRNGIEPPSTQLTGGWYSSTCKFDKTPERLGFLRRCMVFGDVAKATERCHHLRINSGQNILEHNPHLMSTAPRDALCCINSYATIHGPLTDQKSTGSMSTRAPALPPHSLDLLFMSCLWLYPLCRQSPPSHQAGECRWDAWETVTINDRSGRLERKTPSSSS